MEVVIVDALGRGSRRKRVVTIDAIGAGPRTVAGVLEKLGISVDLYPAESIFEAKDLLKKYDILMISAMSIDEVTVKYIIKIWRRNNDKKPAIIGGPIVSDTNSVLRVNSDLGLYGEAEPIIESLFVNNIVSERGIDYNQLKDQCGVIYRKDHFLVVNRRCRFMRRVEWEKYMPSTRTIKSYPLYWASRVFVEVVRGCSNYLFPHLEEIMPRELLPPKPRPGCAYCSVVSLWGYTRSRSIELVVREVKLLIDEGVRRIVLSGPDILDYGRDWLVEPKPLVNPRVPPPNLAALRTLFERLKSIPEIDSKDVVVMAENTKPCLVTDDAARTLGEYLEGTPIHIGAEVGDDTLLRRLGRPTTTEETINAVKLLRKYGLLPYVYIMYCLPGEDEEVVRKTLRFMDELYRAGAEKITAYRFMPLHNSYLEKLITTKMCKGEEVHPVKKKAITLNKLAKKKFLGSKVKAVIVGYHYKYKRPVAYPLSHGPVILVDSPRNLVNKLKPGIIVNVKIAGIITDRIVRGSIEQD